MMNFSDIASLRDSLIKLRQDSKIQAAYWENEVAIFDNVNMLNMPYEQRELNVTVVGVCSSGSCRACINNRIYDLHTNMTMVLFPGQIVQLLDMTDDFNMMVICLSAERNQVIINQTRDIVPLIMYIRQHPIIETPEQFVSWAKDYCHLCMRAFSCADLPFRNQMYEALLSTLYYNLANVYGNALVSSPLHNSRQEEIFMQFLQLLEKQYTQYRDVAYYAERLCVTPKYLSSVVKAVSGRTAGVCIDSYVVEEAKRQLRTTRLSVLEISQNLNFPNQSFFGKYFKRLTHQSPYQYRKTHII